MSKSSNDNSFLVSLVTFKLGRQGARERALKARFPEEPWRWREDWDQGFVVKSAENGPVGAWFAALVTLGIGGLATGLAWHDLMGGKEPLLWLVLIFPVLGLGLLLRALLVTARALKYGRPVLRLEETPCALGREVRGTIEFQGMRLPATDAAELEIQERHVVVRKTSREAHYETRVAWSLRVPVAIREGATTLPVALPIPHDGAPIDASKTSGVSWRVCLRAAMPGPDLDIAFDLPVFASAEGDPALTKAAIDDAQAEHAIQAGEDALIESLQREGVRLKRHPAGLELRVAPLGLRRFGFAVTALVFAAAPVLFWLVVLRRHPSIWRWLGFAPLAGMGALVFSLTMTKRYRVLAGRKGLRIIRHILGVPTVWQVRYEDISGISPNSTMSTSGAQGTVHYYDLLIEWRTGERPRKVRLGLGITDKAMATALAEALRHASQPDV
jgi:hypothetical protein